MQLDEHAEELASDLGVDKEEVTKDLQNLVQYSVPIEEAKQSLRRKYGDGSSGGSATPTAVDVADVTTDSGNVTVTVRVLTKGTRSIRYQGEDQTIREGEFADETGKISYTAWTEFGFEPGDTVTVGNAGVREWNDRPELNLGESTSVALESEDLDVPYDIGGDAKLIDLAAGQRGMNVEVEVLELERRTINGRDGETEILSGVVADETARLPVTDWNPRPELEEGATLRLEDVYIREFRGSPSVNLTEFSTATPLDRAVDVREDAPQLSVAEAVGSGGMFDVAVVGNVVAVRDGSGLIQRCPECNRVIQKGQCRSHGEVDGVDDLRVKAIVDDGSDAVTVVLDRELTEEVYGGTMEEAMAAARDAMDQSVVADRIRERIVGREYRARGNLSVDEYGANLDAAEFTESDDDPAERASALLAEVGA
jgi:replication factor A1